MREPEGWWLALALCVLASCATEQQGELDGSIDAEVRNDARIVRLPDAQSMRPDGTAGLGPPYPIVLAHGFFGFEDFAGIDFITYFYGVKDDLAARGETLVFTPAVDPFNDSDARGAELLAHVERIVAETGAAKVNLVGHSQGGLDARWVAHTRPDLVASVTTFATPHRGTPIADVVLGVVEDPQARDLADRLVRLIGAELYDAAGEETSVFASLRQFSTAGIDDFNTRITNAPGIPYYSITGRTDRHDGAPDCDVADQPLFVSRYRRTLDPVEPLLDIPEQIVDGGSADIANDGLVRVRDARWGRFLGCVPADHFDEIGQLFGDRPGIGNDFDYLAFYAELIEWLRAQGH